MDFEKCDNPECSGCHRVDSAEWREGDFSAVTYRGEYALVTTSLPSIIPFSEVAVGVAVGMFPEWISAAVKVGDGPLDAAIADSEDGAEVWVTYETFETDDPESRHEMIADSMSLFVGDSVPLNVDEFMNDVLVSLTEE